MRGEWPHRGKGVAKQHGITIFLCVGVVWRGRVVFFYSSCEKTGGGGRGFGTSLQWVLPWQKLHLGKMSLFSGFWLRQVMLGRIPYPFFKWVVFVDGLCFFWRIFPPYFYFKWNSMVGEPSFFGKGGLSGRHKARSFPHNTLVFPLAKSQFPTCRIPLVTPRSSCGARVFEYERSKSHPVIYPINRIIRTYYYYCYLAQVVFLGLWHWILLKEGNKVFIIIIIVI